MVQINNPGNRSLRQSDPKNSNRRILVFVDRIVWLTLFRICLLNRSIDGIRYFDPITPGYQKIIRFFQITGILSAEVKPITNHIGEVRNGLGESEYTTIYNDILNICDRIQKEKLTTNPLIEEMASLWPKDKITFFFKKLAERTIPGEICMECLRIGLVNWLRNGLVRDGVGDCALIIERKKWFSYLQTYASSSGIRLVGYRRPRINFLIKTVRRLIRLMSQSPRFFLQIYQWKNRLITKESQSHETNLGLNPVLNPSKSKIGICYSGGKISFDPTERSEFFWLHDTGISFSDIILYNYDSDIHLDKDTVQEMYANGVALFGCSPEIPSWSPTSRMFKILSCTMFKIFRSVIKCIAGGKWISPYYFLHLLSLARDYSYWYDFFGSNQIKMNVSIMNATTVGQVLALDALEGLSLAYQHSASNFYRPTTFLSAGENIQFVFSDAFKKLWDRVGAPVDRFVNTGFVFDGAIQVVKNSTNINNVRNRLRNNGAEFIFCFFDENSLDRWDMVFPHEQTARDYKYLFEWLLSDATLGIIFKPKRSKDLFQRISQVSDLLRQAQNTGRCEFLMSETKVGSIYPAEAALMANVSIGKLTGTTAAFEAHLTGIPSILIDTERLTQHPFYAWGQNRIIFDNWDSLKNAVELYRSSPEKCPAFGDWSLGRNDLDPFRDGKASLRMGLFIRWLYEGIEQGVSKQKTLFNAVNRFQKRWGTEHISTP